MKLNIGSGEVVIPGFQNVDRKLGSEAYPLACPDNSVDEIRASHILEHFSFDEVPKVLADWHRALQPGGLIRISVPDLDRCMALKQGGDPHWPHYLMGGQMDADDFHRSVFTEPKLTAFMANAGFKNTARWGSQNTDTASHACSLNLESRKEMPSNEIEKTIKIAAVMSIPRVGWNDTWGCVFDALMPFGIPVTRVSGAFWGQCLQNGMEVLVAKGVDWLLTIDYDSLFTKEHIDVMLGLLGANPNIDALAALQCKRGCDYPLLTTGKREVEIDGSPISVKTAHFGMTLIRVEALNKLPKPWFKAVPGDGGTWNQDSDKIDDDIWFWKEWERVGLTAYVAPSVRIGHIENMVSVFDENMKPSHLHVNDWWKAAKGK